MAAENFSALTSEDERTLTVVRNLIRAGTLMELETDVILSAALSFHHFQDKFKVDHKYYQDVLSATCLLVSSKTLETSVDLRTLATVYFKIVNGVDVDICKPGQDFEIFISSVLRQELFLLRVLKFQIPRISSLHYLLHYLKSLMEFFPTLASNHPLVRFSIMLLMDCHCTNVCIKYGTKQLAIAVIYIMLLSYCIRVPGNSSIFHAQWAECFCKDIDVHEIWKIVDDIMNIYK